MIDLPSTDSLKVALSAAPATNQPQFAASFVDVDSLTFVPGSNSGTLSGATAVTLVAAPSDGVDRQVKHLLIFNSDTAQVVPTISLDNAGALRTLLSVPLQPGERIEYTETEGFRVFAASGAEKSAADSVSYGTYTPTLTNVANVDASTAFPSRWSRIGNQVAVTGIVNIDPTTSEVYTDIRMTLPIASDFTELYDCTGTAASAASSGESPKMQSVGIIAGTANNEAWFRFVTAITTNTGFSFHFTYTVK